MTFLLNIAIEQFQAYLSTLPMDAIIGICGMTLGYPLGALIVTIDETRIRYARR